MPRYHFHVDDGHYCADLEGTELSSVEVAKCEAIQMAGRMICDEAAEFWDHAEWTMTVTDQAGLTLFVINIVGTEAPVIQAAPPPQLSA